LSKPKPTRVAEPIEEEEDCLMYKNTREKFFLKFDNARQAVALF